MTGRVRAVLIAGAVGAVTFNLVTAYVNGWPGPPPPDKAVYVVDSTLVAAAYLLVGFVAWQRYPTQRIGLLFTIIGYAYLLPQISNIYSSVTFAVGNIGSSLLGAALAHLALAWPYGRLNSRWDKAAVITNYAWNIGNTTIGLFFWNPHGNGNSCSCPKNLLLIDDSPRLANDIDSITTYIGLVMTGVIVALVVRHWWTARGYVRASMTRLIWVATPVAAYVAFTDIVSGLDVQLSSLWVFGIGQLVYLAPPLTYGLELARARRARAAVGVALVDLEPGPSPDRLLTMLRQALGDPTVQLAFRSADHGGYLDTSATPVEVDHPPPGRLVAPLDAASDGVLIVDEQLGHEPELLRVTAGAAAMAVQHAQLRAEVEGQLAEVRRSRARIVEAADAARSKLERDLHDGAQQRLVTLSLALGMARTQAGSTDPALQSLLEAATKEATEALVELRELARGIHPAVLTESGLGGAIQALAERAPVAVTVAAMAEKRYPSPVEANAYFVVSEALANVAKHAPTAAVDVSIRDLEDRLLVEVTDNGPGGADPEGGSGLRGLADRVASVGGILHITSPIGSGTRIVAEIPNP